MEDKEKLAQAIDIMITAAIHSGSREDYLKAAGGIEVVRLAGAIKDSFAGLLMNLLNESIREEESKKGRGHKEFRKLWEMKVG